MRSFLIITFTLLIGWFLIHIIVISIDGLADQDNVADVAVILGNKVNEDGTLSPRLEARLACGLKLFRTGRVKKQMM